MSHVTRIVHRRANWGSEKQYEALVKGMLEACARFPGYLFSTVIPPRMEGEEFHIVQNFASQAQLDAWSASRTAADWHARLREVADHDPEYRVFNTTDLWFSAEGLTGERQPARWRLAVVTWLGIFPTASLFVGLLLPALAHLHFVPRMVVVTALIVATMFYLVMPRLLRWMGWWLRN